VCIKEDGKIKEYIKREHAFIISTLIKRGISRVWLLKPKRTPIPGDAFILPIDPVLLPSSCLKERGEKTAIKT
jgi:hypothetical protein